jgi:hypothetical protein
MVHHLRRRLSKCGGRIVAEGHETSVGNLLGKEVFQPEGLRLWVCPGRNGIAAQAVDGHNTKGRLRPAKQIEQEKAAASESSGGTYSTVGDVVASFSRSANMQLSIRAALIWNIYTSHKVHVYEVYAHEVHAYEVHAHKGHAREVRAHEVHVSEKILSGGAPPPEISPGFAYKGVA